MMTRRIEGQIHTHLRQSRDDVNDNVGGAKEMVMVMVMAHQVCLSL